MAENGNGKYPTWKWLVSILIGVVLLSAGGWITRVETKMGEKVDKDQYRLDIADIKDGIKDINSFLRNGRK